MKADIDVMTKVCLSELNRNKGKWYFLKDTIFFSFLRIMVARRENSLHKEKCFTRQPFSGITTKPVAR
jgi:hypothetical protein